MSADRAQDDMVCQRAVTLIVDLCLAGGELLDQDTCQDFFFLLSSEHSDRKGPGEWFFLLLICLLFCVPEFC
ncbi:hypothetical protein NHX12_013364 [Muraenolepis orangiensis]|uniref:Uncharacterized protein n=1 Tax=Muraenolepis orangiensis TaxID=630683 RepID=A0A9Q0DEH0_9TELE|nr:hypothetical protein NHX12_013364 [Muraenolepis orangiensis]